MVLEAIRYERGKLKLLEQRKLPYETTWVDIKTCEDGWQAIRDMTVRGAPAIAISGALSLAVELVNGQRFKSASEAADVIEKKLRYLETRCARTDVCGGTMLQHLSFFFCVKRKE